MAAILVRHLGFRDLSKSSKKTSKICSKVIKTIRNTIKRSKYLKNAFKKVFLTFLRREIEIVKNMTVKIWLPWKSQVTRTVTCHIKLLPDKFWKKFAKFGSVCCNIKKVINVQSRRGQNTPPPPPPPV